jgi:hypothetical protein
MSEALTTKNENIISKEAGKEVGLDDSAMSLSKRQTQIPSGTTDCETQ